MKDVRLGLSPKNVLWLSALPWAWMVCAIDYLLPGGSLFFASLPMVGLPCWAAWIGRRERLGREIIVTDVCSIGLSVVLALVVPLGWKSYFEPFRPVMVVLTLALMVLLPQGFLWRFAEKSEDR